MAEEEKAKEKGYPTRFQRAACWSALAGLGVALIVVLVGALVYGLWASFVALEPVLLPVIIAGCLAYLLHPCVVWVQKWVKKRIFAVLVVMLGAGLFLGALGTVIIPPLVEQTSLLISKRSQITSGAVDAGRDFLRNNKWAHFAVDSLYETTLHEQGDSTETPAPGTSSDTPVLASDDYMGKAQAVLNYHSSSLAKTGMKWLTAGTRALYGALGFLIGIVMIPVFLFYFLLQSEAITRYWHTILPLRNSHFRDELVETLRQINDNIISFVRGQMLVSLFDGALLAVALKVMGLPYALTIGAAAALLGIIPYIGMISTSIPALLIAWVTWHDAGHVVAVLIIFLAVSQLDGWIIQPRVLGKRMHMHDLTVMFSVLFWGSLLGGIVGALLAVPLTASIKVIFMRYVWSTLGHSSPEAVPQDTPSSLPNSPS